MKLSGTILAGYRKQIQAELERLGASAISLSIDTSNKVIAVLEGITCELCNPAKTLAELRKLADVDGVEDVWDAL